MRTIKPTYQIIQEANSNDFDIVCSEHNVKKEADEAFARVSGLNDGRFYYLEKVYSAKLVMVDDLVEWRNAAAVTLKGVDVATELIGKLDQLMGLNK